MDEPLPHFILPVGTQVVSRAAVGDRPAGAVGEIVKAPLDATHSYVVRFIDGGKAALKRSDLSIRKHEQRAGFEQDRFERDSLFEFVIFRCVVGSRAYGLEHEASDVDTRGAYLPPANLHWSLAGVPEQLESLATEEVYWELGKFVRLALKANPNVLECLYTPLVEVATPLARDLLDARDMFLSKLVYQTYNGYVLSQFKKIEQDVRSHGAVKWKHAMHLVRLLLAGVTILEEGTVPVRFDEYREKLLAIRFGRIAWEEVDRWRLELHARFDRAYEKTKLPERPDYERANAFLIRARREMV